MGLPLKLVRDNEPGHEPRRDGDIKSISREDRSRAFDMLVSRYQKRLYYHSLYITKNSETAMDVAQEVFVKAFHEPRLFEEGFHTKAWLFRVCTNRCYNLIRDRQRRGGILDRIGKESDILRSSHQAIDDLRREVIDVAMLAAEKVIQESLDDLAHRRLIDEALEESGRLKKE